MSVSYDATLVLFSVVVAIVGSFTGLLITSRVEGDTDTSYKLMIAVAATIIGCSIWSMHFIAMLAIGVPIPLNYDALTTTISVFVAILLTSLGLYAASSGRLNRFGTPIGAVLMASGIAGMHYVAMNAIRANCVISYGSGGAAASVLSGIALSCVALRQTFGNRSPWEVASGAVALGLGVSTMHFIAMASTTLVPSSPVALVSVATLTQHNVAFIVATTTFLICGLFLATVLPDRKREAAHAAPVGPANCPSTATVSSPQLQRPECVRIPVHHNRATILVDPKQIVAARADGHYCWIAIREADGQALEHFCEQSISVLTKQLTGPSFMRSHRSHIVNMEYVASYRRHGDGGLLLLDSQGKMSIPVSRAHVHEVLKQLESRRVNTTMSSSTVTA